MKDKAQKMIQKIKQPFIKAAEIIKPRNTFEWILLGIAVPVPLGVVLWVVVKTLITGSEVITEPEPTLIYLNHEYQETAYTEAA